MIDIQDQYRRTLGLGDGQQQRYDSVLQSLAEAEIAGDHKQIASEADPATEDTILYTDSDDSQRQIADLDNLIDALSNLSDDISETLPFFTPRVSPLGSQLELSGTVYPEEYVTEGPLHERLAVFSMVELHRTSTTRVDKYFLLFAKDARRWSRVTVIATTAIESRLSEVSSTFLPLGYHVLPGLVQPQLEATLSTAQLDNLVTSIYIELESNNESQVSFDPEVCQIIGDLQEIPLANTSRYVEEIEHQGLPQYLESEVVVLSRINTQLYLVSVGSIQLIERKPPFTANGASDVDSFLADMKLLQMAQGCTGVAKFAGVVLSDDRTQICSYLLQFPEQGPVSNLLHAATGDGPIIPWKRRERWIRQIVTTVAEIHMRGILIGHLDLFTIWVDSDDNIILLCIKSAVSSIRNKEGFAPPELRGLTTLGDFVTNNRLTTQSDLFQLRLCIWMLTEHVPTMIGTLCPRSGCETFPRYRCTANHANPIGLPLCGSEAPDCLDVIIGHCRQEQPGQRKPARVLLAMLPTTDHGPTDFYPTVISFQNYSFWTIVCDECAKLTTDEHYHCNVCYHGHFDLCPQCFLVNDVSCNDDCHKLSRRIRKNYRLVNEMTRVL